MAKQEPMAFMSQNDWGEPTEENVRSLSKRRKEYIMQRVTSEKEEAIKKGTALERVNWLLADYEINDLMGESILTDKEKNGLLKFSSEKMREDYQFYDRAFSALASIEPYVVLSYNSYRVEADELIRHLSLHEGKVKAQLERCALLTEMRKRLKDTGAISEELIQKMVDGVMESAPLKGQEFVWDEGLEMYVGAFNGGFPVAPLSEGILGYAREKKERIEEMLSAFKGYAVAIQETLSDYGLPTTFPPIMVRACIDEAEREAHLDFMQVNDYYRQSYLNDLEKKGGSEWESYKEQLKMAEEQGFYNESTAYFPDYRRVKVDRGNYKSAKKVLKNRIEA